MRVGVPTAPREVLSMKSLTCQRMSALYQVDVLYCLFMRLIVQILCNLLDSRYIIYMVNCTELYFTTVLSSYMVLSFCFLFSLRARVALLLNQQRQENAHWLHPKWLPLCDRKVRLHLLLHTTVLLLINEHSVIDMDFHVFLLNIMPVSGLAAMNRS